MLLQALHYAMKRGIYTANSYKTRQRWHTTLKNRCRAERLWLVIRRKSSRKHGKFWYSMEQSRSRLPTNKELHVILLVLLLPSQRKKINRHMRNMRHTYRCFGSPPKAREHRQPRKKKRRRREKEKTRGSRGVGATLLVRVPYRTCMSGTDLLIGQNRPFN